MSLQTVAESGWIPVPIANIQGIPGGFPQGAQIQTCKVKFNVFYSELSNERSLNISTEISSNQGVRRYLTADENLISKLLGI